MRVEKIIVLELFGIFNHTINLNMIEQVTIIHGPNGFGKTVLLSMVHNLFNLKLSEITNVPFKEFIVHFDNDTFITVKKEKAKHNTNSLRILLNEHGIKTQSYTYQQSEELIRWRVSDDDHLSNRLHSIVFEENLIFDSNKQIYLKNSEKNGIPAWLRSYIKKVPVTFIQVQRLFSLKNGKTGKNDTPMELVVENYAQDLARKIKSKLAEAAALYQTLDRNFPVRLVELKELSNTPISLLQNRFSALEEKRSRLIAAGLLDKEKDIDFSVILQVLNKIEENDENTKKVLSVYVDDVEIKLSFFNELLGKIEFFERIINSRFQYKKVFISKEEGFVFETHDKNKLSPKSLSSGEQHQLVLLYDLLFNVEPTSLVLIDEPEVSLHIGWQISFLKDLQEIIRLSKFDVLIATHSPEIIDSRWDLTVQLKGPDDL